MIRQATKFDKPDICDMMRMFRAEADLPEYADIENIDHLLDPIFAGQGVIFLEEKKGFLMAIILPAIWSNKILCMHELAWFVKPEERNTSLGYRLFVTYLNYGKQLKSEGRINYFTITKLDTSPDLRYSKYGFRKKDENWIQ